MMERASGFVISVAAPVLGFKHERVMPTGCACDQDHEVRLGMRQNSSKETSPDDKNKAKFSCEFNITQDNTEESFDQEDDGLVTDHDYDAGGFSPDDPNTIMSVTLDAVMDDRSAENMSK
jgi:hypothetical protein